MGARDRIGLAALALTLALSLLPPGARTAGAQEACDKVLPGCGICYPGGYDRNTFGSVEGRLLDLRVPEEGPVRFVVAAEAERWVVLASPAWFWKIAEPSLTEGAVVTVRGSKTLGADGNLYIVASEIQPHGTEAVVLLRDRAGSPLWKGGARSGRTSGGGTSPGGGQGMMGRGRNGGGRR